MTEKQKLIKRLDEWFSRYIRLRDAGADGYFVCISCGSLKCYNQMDCGHYINRQHMATRFSEVNCNGQCRSCNRFDEGNIQGYRRGLELKYGKNQVLLLESMKYEIRQYSIFELKALIEHYKKKVQELRKKKPRVQI